jgi:hypothetical protein
MLDGRLKTKQSETREREIVFFFQPPRYTTTERDAIKGEVDGMIILNKTLNKLQWYNIVSGNWETITSV